MYCMQHYIILTIIIKNMIFLKRYFQIYIGQKKIPSPPLFFFMVFSFKCQLNIYVIVFLSYKPNSRISIGTCIVQYIHYSSTSVHTYDTNTHSSKKMNFFFVFFCSRYFNYIWSKSMYEYIVICIYMKLRS